MSNILSVNTLVNSVFVGRQIVGFPNREDDDYFRSRNYYFKKIVGATLLKYCLELKLEDGTILFLGTNQKVEVE